MPDGILGTEEIPPGSSGLTPYSPVPTLDDVTRGWLSGNYQAVLSSDSKPVAQGNIYGQDVFGPYSGYKVVLCGHPIFTMVEELTDDVDGTPFDAGGVRTYVRRFRVTCKINFIGPGGVCQCPGIPLPFAPYIPGRSVESDLQAKVVKISARREVAGDWKNWIVTVNYSTEMPLGGRPDDIVQLGAFPVGTQNEPWKENPYIRFEGEETQDCPEVDLDGKAYLNIVNQPFTPPPTFPGGMAGMIIRRNERHATLESVLNRVEEFNYVVNQVNFLGRLPGMALCKVESAEEVYRGDVRYWVFVYRIRFKKHALFPAGKIVPEGETTQTWQPRILNAGMYRWRKVFGAPLKNLPMVPIMRGALPVSHPVPLDLNGQPIVADADGKIVPVYLKFRHYREVDLAALTLPAGKL